MEKPSGISESRAGRKCSVWTAEDGGSKLMILPLLQPPVSLGFQTGNSWPSPKQQLNENSYVKLNPSHQIGKKDQTAGQSQR